MNTNYGLTYPKETDFYDINIFNRNFSALADGIDKAKNNNTVKSNYEIVIASENSSERVKKTADFICSAEDSSIVFQKCNKFGRRRLFYICGKWIL